MERQICRRFPSTADPPLLPFSPIPTWLTIGFDELLVNNALPFSWQFGLETDEQVVHAVLSLALKKAGGTTANDSIYYESLDHQLQFAADLGLTTELSSTDATVVLLEFSSPADLSHFRDGEFNVVLTDDVGIDWARLELTIADKLPGDFDFDGDADATDIDLLCGALGSSTSLFDLNGDGAVDALDVDQMIRLEIGTLFGDANLDFVVDTPDFNQWNSHKFTGNSGWTGGDFNCDGVTDTSDFNIWNSNKFQSAVIAVPEPATLIGLWGLVVLTFLRGQTRFLT